MVDLEAIAYRIDPRARREGSGYSIRCPLHDDATPSASISADREGNILVHCHVCGRERQRELFDRVRELAGDLMPNGNGMQRKAPTTYTHYPYTNEQGTPLYRAVRVEPGKNGKRKSFYQQRYTPGTVDQYGNRDWTNGLKGVSQFVLYRLPELLHDIEAGKTIVIVEGEKAVDFLRNQGIAATTAIMGAGKWKPKHYVPTLRGCNVVVVPDNDDAGIAHAQDIASSLEGVAASVRVVLPNYAHEKDGLDDWIGDGNSVEAFWALPEHATVPPVEAEQNGRPQIDATNVDLPTITDAIWAAIRNAPIADELYARGGGILRINGDIETFDERSWRSVVCRLALFAKRQKNGAVLLEPTRGMLQDSLDNPPGWVRILTRITDVPVIVRDGRIIDQSGYDEKTGILYRPSVDVPGEMPLEQAKTLVLDNLFADFPFASDADLANAVALLLLPFVRELIEGPTPMHLIEAASPGTGKSLLAKALSIIWHGGVVAFHTPLSLTNDEQEKRMVGILRDAPETVIFDNVNVLGGPHLDNALTSERFSGRILGTNASTNVPIKCTWIATGNNVSILGDTPRRIVPIRIVATEEDPSLRDGFRINDLQGWARQNRGALVRACLTLAQHGLSGGDFVGMRVGSYEAYSAILGRILHNVGIDSFLGNLVERRIDNDRLTDWRAVVYLWFREHGSTEITARKLWETIKGDDCPLSFRGETFQAQIKSLGHMLRKQVGSVYNVQIGDTSAKLQINRRTDRGKENFYSLTNIPNIPGTFPEGDSRSESNSGNAGISGNVYPRPIRARARAHVESATHIPGIPGNTADETNEHHYNAEFQTGNVPGMLQTFPAETNDDNAAAVLAAYKSRRLCLKWPGGSLSLMDDAGNVLSGPHSTMRAAAAHLANSGLASADEWEKIILRIWKGE